MALYAFSRRDASHSLLSVFDSRLDQYFAPSAAINADILAMGAMKNRQGIQLFILQKISYLRAIVEKLRELKKLLDYIRQSLVYFSAAIMIWMTKIWRNGST